MKIEQKKSVFLRVLTGRSYRLSILGVSPKDYGSIIYNHYKIYLILNITSTCHENRSYSVDLGLNDLTNRHLGTLIPPFAWYGRIYRCCGISLCHINVCTVKVRLPKRVRRQVRAIDLSVLMMIGDSRNIQVM